MESLYISQQGCYVSLRQGCVLVKQGQTVLQSAQLPMLEQVLVFGQSQLTTQLIRACLDRSISIAYLSRMGRCYGRILPIMGGYRALARHQYGLPEALRLAIARQIVGAKLKNCRVILQRQQRRQATAGLGAAIAQLQQAVEQAARATSTEQLMGYEGAGAAAYFGSFGDCLTGSEFVWEGRSRRPPLDPINAMLSFGYQVLWNHLLCLIELRGLDPYEACLHQGGERHPALASDLIEVFRAPIVDSLVLYLIHRRMVNAVDDFVFPATGGCFLNESGRKKLLLALIGRMEESVQVAPGVMAPRWDTLNRQVKAYRQVVLDHSQGYEAFRIR
jgi:CRISP-associated protein Cas1